MGPRILIFGRPVGYQLRGTTIVGSVQEVANYYYVYSVRGLYSERCCERQASRGSKWHHGDRNMIITMGERISTDDMTRKRVKVDEHENGRVATSLQENTLVRGRTTTYICWQLNC